MPASPSADPAGALQAGALRASLKEGHLALRADYEAHANPRRMLRGRARLVSGVLKALWRDLALPSSLTLVAVGGYGRGELFPHSDVDILILLPEAADRAVTANLEQFVSQSWDLGLELGSAVRTVAECVNEAARDITVLTTLLEARWVVGSRKLYQSFAAAMHAQLDPIDFYEAKRLEQAQRYARFNDTPYSLEANCKESPGGLRDLQTVLWVSRGAGLGSSWKQLAQNGLMTPVEAKQLRANERFVQNTRIRLHYLAGRREDRVVFDLQEALAGLSGCEPTAAKRASEVFMQKYFRNAKAITQINTILIQNLAARLLPGLEGPPIIIGEHFQMTRDLLDVRDDDVFLKDPRAILKAFLTLQQRSELKGMTARTLRALWRARHRIDEKFRRDSVNQAGFLEIFRQRRGITHEIRRMNQWGILGSYLPAFGRIVGQMQHDLFHVYTVDQHILQVIRNLRRFTLAEHAHEYPLCSRLIVAFEDYWLLYLGALFHDIAKGRGGDHSQLGAQDARTFCRQHALEAEHADIIVFLVEHHLTMSTFAQKHDLSDAKTIRDFAAIVGTERRLTALYLLTVADIRGTSPKVWNNWKGKLLEDLFHATSRLLSGATPQQALGVDERQADARRILRYYGLRPDIEVALWKEFDTVYFMRHDAEETAWHTRMLYYRVAGTEPIVKARVTHIDESLQVMVYTPDQPHLVARMCGYFTRLGYTIVDAKIHTTRHGYALDSFIILDPSCALSSRDMISLIEHDLAERLRTQAPLDPPGSTRLSRQLKHFPIEPEVDIRPDDRGSHYIMSVTAADRPGLLFCIAQILSDHGINLHTAKIATLGERAEDTFLISGAELAHTRTLLRIEQELMERLQV